MRARRERESTNASGGTNIYNTAWSQHGGVEVDAAKLATPGGEVDQCSRNSRLGFRGSGCRKAGVEVNAAENRSLDSVEVDIASRCGGRNFRGPQIEDLKFSGPAELISTVFAHQNV